MNTAPKAEALQDRNDRLAEVRPAYLEALMYLAKDKELRKRQALSGRQFVEKNYSKQRLVEDIKDLYRELA